MNTLHNIQLLYMINWCTRFTKLTGNLPREKWIPDVEMKIKREKGAKLSPRDYTNM